MVKQAEIAAEASDGTAALAKGMALMRAIVADDGASGLGEIGDRLGLSRTTVHRLLAELQRQGLVMRTRRGRYGAGLGLIGLGAGLTLQTQLAAAARDPMRRLSAALGLTGHLGVLQNDMVTYLVKAPSPRATAVFTREHGQLEAYCSGIGKVLLAHLPAAERAAYLAGGPFVALTERTLTAPDRIEAALDRARADGFAADEGEVAQGLRCLAAPVRNPSGDVVAAISVSMMPADARPTDAEILARLRRTAEEIGAKLVERPA